MVEEMVEHYMALVYVPFSPPNFLSLVVFLTKQTKRKGSIPYLRVVRFVS